MYLLKSSIWNGLCCSQFRVWVFELWTSSNWLHVCFCSVCIGASVSGPRGKKYFPPQHQLWVSLLQIRAFTSNWDLEFVCWVFPACAWCRNQKTSTTWVLWNSPAWEDPREQKGGMNQQKKCSLKKSKYNQRNCLGDGNKHVTSLGKVVLVTDV